MKPAQFTITYDGPALADHSIDVRTLSPALLAIGELFDAANSELNGEQVRIGVSVKAHEPGSFSINLQVFQSLLEQGIALFGGDQITAAINLKELLFGSAGLVWFILKLHGRKLDRIERLEGDRVRIIVGTDSFDVPMKLLRLYRDLAVRTALQHAIEEPLEKDGVDSFEARETARDKMPLVTVTKVDAALFRSPEIEDQILVDEIRRAAFSIVSLAFKEDNKWRLHDGQNQISATIADTDFLNRVDRNMISFAKGDVLICDVRTIQTQTATGIHTENIVEKVREHRPGARQLSLPID